MYIPQDFRQENKEEIVRFIRAYPFATLVSQDEKRPLATHLPVHLEANGSGEGFCLHAHFARANPQSLIANNSEKLLIFSGPHAYISPQDYGTEQAVPTWNYSAVHIYGQIEFIDNMPEVLRLMEKFIAGFDHTYLGQWAQMDMEFKTKTAKGIRFFKFNPVEIQAVEKLSQNKADAVRQKVAARLIKSSDSSAAAIGERMQNGLDRG